MSDDIKRRIEEELNLLRGAFEHGMRDLCARQRWPEPEMMNPSLCSVMVSAPGGPRIVFFRKVQNYYLKVEMPCVIDYPLDEAESGAMANWLLARNAGIIAGYWSLMPQRVLTFVMTRECDGNYDILPTFVEYMARECGEVEQEMTAQVDN